VRRVRPTPDGITVEAVAFVGHRASRSASITEPTGFGDCGQVKFKLATSFPDVDAQDIQSVRSYASRCWPIPPTFCPTNDQDPTAATGDQALDLLLHQ
jgi:hypothetical protein